MNKLVYKGYTAKVEFDLEEKELVGEVEGIKDLVVFSSENCADIEQAFHDSVDGYLESCKLAGKDPDKAYTGSFNVRIDPEDHRELDRLAKKENTTLNNEVASAVHFYLESKKSFEFRDSIAEEILKFSNFDLHDLWSDIVPFVLGQPAEEKPCLSRAERKEDYHVSDSAKA
jgi:predicted HicB family RNase H-like nuclease